MRTGDLGYRIALSGLGLLLLAAVIASAFSYGEGQEDGTAGARMIAGAPLVQIASNTVMPLDLLPERIRLPELPEPDEPAPPNNTKPPEKELNASISNPSLAALKVTNVGLRAPARTQVAFALPGAPDQLTPGIFSLARFGDGAPRLGSRGSDGGWGGVGVRGVGIGRVGGGTCGRNPARPIIERRSGFPR